MMLVNNAQSGIVPGRIMHNALSNRSTMSQRGAFTLIEIFVVVTIIVVLASIAMPMIALVKNISRTVRCSNNLQQLGAAIESYKGENNDAFPGALWRDTPPAGSSIISDDLFHSGGPASSLSTKILLCPFDYTNGMAPGMNRASPPAWTDISYLHETNCSYEYDLSNYPLDATTVTWFYSSTDNGGMPTLGPLVTWSSGKQNQLLNGNRSASTLPGNPFPASVFPILRCYWHNKWSGLSGQDAIVKLINNVSWDMNIFKSTPYWEHDANPNIPLPQ
jgi:type II secretory pathway pseudopilin PulG